MIYKFHTYTFKDGITRVGKCFSRSLEYFNLPYNIKSSKITLNHLFNYLKTNKIDFTLLPFNQDTFNSSKGFLLFYDNNISHMACYDYGLYVDIYDNISYNNIYPNYMIKLKLK